MRILLSGQKRFGRDVLELLLARGDEVVAVSCPAIARRGRPDKLFLAAQNAGLEIIAAGSLSQYTMPKGVDLIVAAHSHDYIGRMTRLKARFGAIGYHPSLLPRHRGRSAIEWAIRFGERITGGTVYWLNDTVDGGPIAMQDHCLIRHDDTAGELWARELEPMGLRLFARVLSDIDAGVIVAIEQDPVHATWEPAIDKVPRLFRPDLPLLGAADFMVAKTRDAAERLRREGAA